ncbi:MAG: 1-acyl-sn-glycerol-3-phosphate acyltransferase [Polyangiaceae bacterium]
MTSETSQPVSSTPIASASCSGRSKGTYGLSIDMSVQQAIASLLKEPRFLRLVRVFAKDRAESLLEAASLAQTETEFQRCLGAELLQLILDATSQRTEVRGTEHFADLPACLYISNHRDIFLDSALLNGELLRRRKPIPHVIIGANLLQSTWLTPFYRLCKAVVVQRDLKGKELFEHSLKLSEYVRSTITGGEPVWIAQRAGRTKDGVDRTEPALLRMLLLAYERGTVSTTPFYVAPIAVSYEIEPCDVFKAAAVLGASTKNASKDRARNDAANILRGLVQPKGRICLTIRPPIVLDNSEARAGNRADKIAELAGQVDREITNGYVIWPTNYIASDLLSGDGAYAQYYDATEKQNFVDYVERRAREIEAPADEARGALLALYARPLSAEPANKSNPCAATPLPKRN